ncbi:hypothetical protein [Arthrobacter sp. 31Y]|uniref:hypothetical protein n=1 Tax=Arthrobacter sp. 31Y TaxID=1115632 RepID=UPI001639C998|nr:hypothetical protein [Arthrobacter sp. 31Y]
MDQQTLTLVSQLITGAVALIAGLGGASLTAYINRRNTLDSLAAARLTAEEQWTRTQDREHAIWLRDQKQEAYAAFHSEAETLFRKINGYVPDEDPPPSIDNLPVLLGRVRLIGSLEAVTLANAMSMHVNSSWVNLVQTRFFQQTGNKEKLDELWELGQQLRTQFDSYSTKFLELVRKELGAQAFQSDA